MAILLSGFRQKLMSILACTRAVSELLLSLETLDRSKGGRFGATQRTTAGLGSGHSIGVPRDAWARRLWGLDQETCDALIDQMVSAKFLRRTASDCYVRDDT